MTDTLAAPTAGLAPDSFRVERSIAIAAPAEMIFPLIQDFRRWTEWSPYEALDPNMLRTYSGADRGLGAAYAWTSKGRAGAGAMEITGVDPDRKITIRLDFSKPFQASNTAEFTLEPRGAQTIVTWAMFGSKLCDNWLMKLMKAVFDMDKMVGKDFDKGLAKLKAAVETRG